MNIIILLAFVVLSIILIWYLFNWLKIKEYYSEKYGNYVCWGIALISSGIIATGLGVLSIILVMPFSNNMVFIPLCFLIYTSYIVCVQSLQSLVSAINKIKERKPFDKPYVEFKSKYLFNTLLVIMVFGIVLSIGVGVGYYFLY